MGKARTSSTDDSVLSRPIGEHEVHDLVAHLQGFNIDLMGNRYSPFEVLYADVSQAPRDDAGSQDDHSIGTCSAHTERGEAPEATRLARTLAMVFDRQIDRKLVVPSRSWPGPELEPEIQLPEQLFFNAFKLAELLQNPDVLGEALQKLHSREQQQPLFNSEIRSALLGALLANQRGTEYLSIWKDIFAQGQSSDGYFVSHQRIGRQGILRCELSELKRAIASAIKKSPRLQKRQIEEVSQIAEALTWRDKNKISKTVELKSEFKALVDHYCPKTSPESAWRIIELAEISGWSKWMCRRLPLVTILQETNGSTRLCLRGEVFMCVPADRFDSRPNFLSKAGFVQVHLPAGDQSLVTELRKSAATFQKLLERNSTSSESKEIGDIIDWFREMEEQSESEGARERLREGRQMGYDYFTKGN